MTPQIEEPEGAGPVIGLGRVGAWLALFHVIGSYTWNYGRRTFLMLTLVVVVLLLASRSLAHALDRLTAATRREGVLA